MTPPSSNSMPNDEIRARCEKVAKSVDPILSIYGNVYPENIQALESLYREAMAAGLERAAGEMDIFALYDAPKPEQVGMTLSRFCQEFALWCRKQASKMKEAT